MCAYRPTISFPDGLLGWEKREEGERDLCHRGMDHSSIILSSKMLFFLPAVVACVDEMLFIHFSVE